MYGAQTLAVIPFTVTLFENDVEMYGAQTLFVTRSPDAPFENDVEMYGAQTMLHAWKSIVRLRMM